MIHLICWRMPTGVTEQSGVFVDSGLRISTEIVRLPAKVDVEERVAVVVGVQMIGRREREFRFEP